MSNIADNIEKYLEEFLQNYIQAALWSSLLPPDDTAEFMDAKYDSDDLAPETFESMKRECLEFIAGNQIELAEANKKHGRGADSCGHDFWLNRNGHGAGFWDRGMGELGERLSVSAKSFKEAHLYVGDDEKIYQE